MQLHRLMLTNWFSIGRAWRNRLLWGSALGLTGVIYLKVVIPVFHIHVPCIFSEVTGFDCPGCGLTRAALALLDLNIYQAFRYNMLVFVLTPFYLVYFLLMKRGFKKSGEALMLLMLVSAVAFGVLRNIPMFDWLAPTIVQ
jgi:hypothetical protein